MNSQSSLEIKMLEIGEILPDFQLYPIETNKVLKFSDLKGRIFIINFWATWCNACMNEIKTFIQLYEEYQNKGLTILGINLDEYPEHTLPIVKQKLPIHFPLFQDPQGKLSELFQVHALPFTVICNQKRNILFTYAGEFNWNSTTFIWQLQRWLSE